MVCSSIYCLLLISGRYPLLSVPAGRAAVHASRRESDNGKDRVADKRGPSCATKPLITQRNTLQGLSPRVWGERNREAEHALIVLSHLIDTQDGLSRELTTTDF